MHCAAVKAPGYADRRKEMLKEGVVPGGGVALIRAQKSLDKLEVLDEQRFGVAIIRRAIEEPLRQIAQNAGAEGAVVVGRYGKARAVSATTPLPTSTAIYSNKASSIR